VFCADVWVVAQRVRLAEDALLLLLLLLGLDPPGVPLTEGCNGRIDSYTGTPVGNQSRPGAGDSGKWFCNFHHALICEFQKKVTHTKGKSLPPARLELATFRL
jgi:hypothetical protein